MARGALFKLVVLLAAISVGMLGAHAKGPYCLLWEDFAGVDEDEIPSDWMRNTLRWGSKYWSAAGGSSPEMAFWWHPGEEGIFILRTPPIDATGHAGLALSFKHYVHDHLDPPGGYILRVDTAAYNHEIMWTLEPSGHVGPETITVDLSSRDGQVFEVWFVVQGNTERIRTWHIDDVRVLARAVRRCRAVASGWTLFGLPVSPTDQHFDALEFDPPPTDVHMFWWDPDEAAYEGRGELELRGMSGYWLFVTHDQATYQVCIEGDSLTGTRAFELGAAGWQMISVPYPVAWGPAEGGSVRVRLGMEDKSLQEAIDAMWVHHTLFAWDAVGDEWQTHRSNKSGITMEPWTGYYLFAHQDDLVLLYSEEEQGESLWNEGQALSTAALSFDPGEPPLPPLLAAPSEWLSAVAYPNPAGDGREVTFAAQGPLVSAVEALRVTVHDLSGRLVYSGESERPSLLWDTVGPTGAPVASGVYLYTVEAKMDGQWVRVGVDRMLILR